MTYDMRNPQIEALLREYGRSMKRTMPEGWGFILIMFEFDSDATFYLSSGDRKGSIELMRETATKMENNE